MKLIAKKPCNFGGRKFYIGSEVPTELVADPKAQERLGVLVIVGEEAKGVSGEQPGTFFTQEQVDGMIAEAVSTATVQIVIKGDSSGENEQVTISATPEEIQQVFSIMQLNANEGAEAIVAVKSENVLILLHAADSRKTIKDAAKKQADNLSSTSGSSNESTGGNATTDTSAHGDTKGVDG